MQPEDKGSHPWTVITEEGKGKTKRHQFKSLNRALDYFSQRWVTRIVVDPEGIEICANSGLNPVALRRIRAELQAEQAKVEAAPCKVLVAGISGRCLEAQLPGTATVGDVKDCIESNWGIAHGMQRIVKDDVVIEDSDVLSSLVANTTDASPLEVTVVADPARFSTEYEEIWQKVAAERMKPTNAASRDLLLKLLDRADEIEKVMLRHGIHMNNSHHRVYVRERPSTLPQSFQKKTQENLHEVRNAKRHLRALGMIR